MLGELERDEIEQVLQSEVVGRIGCVADGWPYVVPVTYAYDGESVYTHCADGLKLRAMRERPDVCFEVEQVRSINEWRTVVARGRFEPLWRDDEERAMDLLAARFAPAQQSEAPRLDRSDNAHRRDIEKWPVLFRIRLMERTGRFESSEWHGHG